MQIHNYILSKIKFSTYYSTVLGGGMGNFVCPFHTDNNPSLNIREDGSAYCYGCRKKWKNIIEFDMALNKSTLDKTLFSLFHNFITPLIRKSLYMSYAKNLPFDDTPPYNWLLNRGIGPSTIQSYLIGFDSMSNRITIPVFNEWGYCVNLRMVRYTEDDSSPKVISYKKGYGKAMLYPLSAVSHKEIYIMEGEMDTLLATHLGLNAITSTGGAQSFRREFAPYFKEKIVYVCMDNDKAGREGSKLVVKELNGIASKLYNVIISEKYGKDFTDYMNEKPIEAFLNLVAKTREISKPDLINYTRIKEMEEFSREETMITELKPGKNILHLIIKISPDE